MPSRFYRGSDGLLYGAPRAEPTTVFTPDRRQSAHVRDLRAVTAREADAPEGLMESLQWTDMTRPSSWPMDHANDAENKHTQAVDGLIARLDGSAIPSRRRYLAPESIQSEVAPDMNRYYDGTATAVSERALRRMLRPLDPADPFADPTQ